MGTTSPNICLECGLCCDGTMFSRLPPVFDDPTSGRIRPEGGGPALVHPAGPAQPCPAHRYACSVYRERPGACHHYECALRLRLAGGEVTHEVAQSLVNRARALRDRARAAIESAIGTRVAVGLNDLAATLLGGSHDDGSGEHAAARSELAALDEILDAHFHLPDDRGSATRR